MKRNTHAIKQNQITPRFLIVGILAGSCLLRTALSVEVAFGDFDFNGYDDLVIGCPDQTVYDSEYGDVRGAGAVTVHYTNASGVGVARSQLFHANSEGIAWSPRQADGFGDALAVGDFNADGVPDLAVGRPGRDGDSHLQRNEGDVTIIYGSVVGGLRSNTSGAWRRLDHTNLRGSRGSNTRQDGVGSALAVGDFNRDGNDDLAIGVPGAGEDSEGMVYVVYGPMLSAALPKSESWSQKGGPGALETKGNAEGDDRFGSTLATGDFDGDGYDDLAIGVIGEDTRLYFGADAGAINIIYGAPEGLRVLDTQVFTQDTDGIKENADRRDAFGFSMAVGNFNGDVNPVTGLPVDDLAVGVPMEDFGYEGRYDRGVVHVLYGSASKGLSTTDQLWHDSSTDFLGFGVGVAHHWGYALAAADLDGDGYDDLAIGIPKNSERKGTTLVFNGSNDLLKASGRTLLFQVGDDGVDGTRFGMAMATGNARDGRIHDLAIASVDTAYLFNGPITGLLYTDYEKWQCLEATAPSQPGGGSGVLGSISGGPGGSAVQQVGSGVPGAIVGGPGQGVVAPTGGGEAPDFTSGLDAPSNGELAFEEGSPGAFRILALEHDPKERTTGIVWKSVPGMAYRVERSTDLRDWISIAESVSSEGGVTFYEDVGAPGNQQYYRVKASVPSASAASPEASISAPPVASPLAAPFQLAR